MKKVYNTLGADRTQALWQYVTGQNIPNWSDAADYAPGDTVLYEAGVVAAWLCVQATNPSVEQTPSLESPYWVPYNAVGTGVDDLILRDGYVIGPPIYYPGAGLTNAANFGTYPLVDGDVPILYTGKGPCPIQFTPFAIEHDKLSYKTGFEQSALELTLQPRDNYNYNADAIAGGLVRGGFIDYNHLGAGSEGIQTAAPYWDNYITRGTFIQSMRMSFAQGTDWYLAPVTAYRFFMPKEGDVSTFGAVIMFRGRISSLTVDKESVKVTVGSLMEIFKQKVPSQTIQPGNRWAPFDFNTTPDYVGTATSPTSSQAGASWIQVSISGGAPAAETLSEGWAQIIVPGTGTWWRSIYTNANTSGDTTYVVFIEPLPLNLSTVSGVITVNLYESSDTSTNPNGPGSGFPYVPIPFTGVG